MKENAIKKINLMGKVGNIVAIIAKVLIILALVGSVAGFIFFTVAPENLCKVSFNGAAKVDVDLGMFGVKMDDNMLNEIKAGVKDNAQIEYSGNEFEVSDVQANGDGFTINAGAKMAEFSIRDLRFAFMGLTIYTILILVTLVFASRLAKAFRNCTSPFEENVIKKMKQFAYSLIPWAVGSSIIDSIMAKMFVASSKFSLNLNLGVVIVVLIILALAYIFQYGAVLQQESDETL